MSRWAPLLLAGALGCAGAPAAPKTAAAKPAPKAAPAAEPAPERVAETQPQEASKEDDGILSVAMAVQDFATAKVPLRPVSVDVGALPRVALPPVLTFNDRPAEMPAGPRTAFKTEEAYRGSNYDHMRALYFEIEGAPLTRLQIGTVTANNTAAAKAYVTCYDNYPSPIIQPARWETLTTDEAGAVHYRVTDAWFDGKECGAVALQTIDVKPTPIAGGLMYAFIDECKSCGHPQVVVLAPGNAVPRAAGLGAESMAAMGTFTIATLPVQRGGSASFIAHLTQPGMTEWFNGIKHNSPLQPGSSLALIGFDVAQAVEEGDPTAIAYATVVMSSGTIDQAVLSSMFRPRKVVRPRSKSMAFARENGF